MPALRSQWKKLEINDRKIAGKPPKYLEIKQFLDNTWARTKNLKRNFKIF